MKKHTLMRGIAAEMAEYWTHFGRRLRLQHAQTVNAVRVCAFIGRKLHGTATVLLQHARWFAVRRYCGERSCF